MKPTELCSNRLYRNVARRHLHDQLIDLVVGGIGNARAIEFEEDSRCQPPEALPGTGEIVAGSSPVRP